MQAGLTNTQVAVFNNIQLIEYEGKQLTNGYSYC